MQLQYHIQYSDVRDEWQIDTITLSSRTLN